MSTSLTSDFETPRASRRGKAEKVAFVAAKLVVTGACFWYVSRQIEWQQVWSAIPLLDFRWAGLATLLAMLEIPLVGLRWGNVVSALAARDQQPTWAAMLAATGAFDHGSSPTTVADGVIRLFRPVSATPASARRRDDQPDMGQAVQSTANAHCVIAHHPELGPRGRQSLVRVRYTSLAGS